jgi:hypothetical protein
MSDQERVKEFLKTASIMVIAVTLEDSSPWAVPVKIQRQEGNIFEWDSKLDTVHSVALGQKPEMAVVLFDKAESVQFGLYLKGRAELVTANDKGFGRYRFSAESAWINDESFVKRPIPLSSFPQS